ncbi:alpha/beta fold hydrolase [Streptomyces sp. NPDC056144]|uniref:alpha/beta fold hydrolase n=1 Tax=unclassified Streptomyces TaxID=2593676 RepID=UPI0035E11CA6
MPHFTTYDGTQLAYRTLGEGAGEPLICLPGGPMRDSAYLGDLGGLDAHRTLVLLDLRGTGASAEPADPATYRCDRQVEDVEALRAHLGLDRIDLLGHSAGGNLATLYAAAHPDRVRSLVLVTSLARALGVTTTDEEWDAAAEIFADAPWYAKARAEIDAIDDDTPEARVREITAPFAYGRWDEAARQHAGRGTRETHATAAPAFHGEGAYTPEETRRALAVLTAPVLILAGEYDAAPTPAKAEQGAACFPYAGVRTLPGSSHFPWIDDPETFVREVTAFLDPEIRTLTVDGVRLAYRVYGSEDAAPTAPPVVLVHGRGENGTGWREIAEALAGDHRVYVPDLRGHGLSDRPGGYGFAAFRDELGGFLRALGLTGATVVAHSMGGGAAYLLAQREPELIGRLVLEEPPGFVPLDPPRPPAARPEGPLPCDWAVVTTTDAELNAPDPAWRADAGRITVPTLVLAGGPSSHVPQDHLAGLAERIPGARLVTIDASHMMHEVRPAEFLAAVREFGL